MGRRDEPKLDELQRLLRRLEHMEVDKTPKATAKPTSQDTNSADDAAQSTGYVGALRGGPVGEPKTGRPTRTYDDDASPDNDVSDRKRAHSSSTAPVVVGATTAAVISSLIVVGLLLYTQGNDRDGQAEPKRLNFIVPGSSGGQPVNTSEPSRAAAEPVDTDTLPPETQSLLLRADQHIRSGQLGEARTLLEEAARLGSGVAALTLGAMYDPTRVAEFGNLGVQADPTLARAWYERARALGEVEASNRLAELARK